MMNAGRMAVGIGRRRRRSRAGVGRTRLAICGKFKIVMLKMMFNLLVLMFQTYFSEPACVGAFRLKNKIVRKAKVENVVSNSEIDCQM